MQSQGKKIVEDSKRVQLVGGSSIGTISGSDGTVYPFPSRFIKVGTVSTRFRWWGRHTAHIGGETIPSERWDNNEIQSLNVVSGYEVNIGNIITHNTDGIEGMSNEERKEAEALLLSKDDPTTLRNTIKKLKNDLKQSGVSEDEIDDIFIDAETAGDDSKKLLQNGGQIDDQIDLKFRGNGHKNGKGGWYIPNMTFLNGKAQTGKEYPHPTTRHYNFQTGPKSFGSIKGTWVGFLTYCYNDKNGVPVNGLYVNYKPARSASEVIKPEDYVFAGESRDTGNMSPGPVLKKIAQLGGGSQSLQIRVDSAPKVYPNGIRRYFAVAINTPED